MKLKNKKINKIEIFFIICIFFNFLSCFYTLSLSSYSKVIINKKVIINQGKKIVLDKKEIIVLEKYEIKQLDNLLKFSKMKKYQFYNLPEITIHCYDKYNRVRTISIFYKEGLIYNDDYLKALTESMNDNDSYCYIMTDQAKEFFKKYIEY